MKKIQFFKNKETAIENAALFEDVIYKKEQRLKWVYLGTGILGALIGVLSLIALIIVLPLKETETYIYSVDNQTGRAEEMTKVTNSTLNENEAVSRFFVDTYLKAREGYNYFRLQQDYDLVMSYSSDSVGNEYTAIFKSPQAPQTIYRKGEQTVKVDVLSKIISDSSKADDPDKLASVRYKRTITEVLTGSKREEFWVARITFRFIPENTLTREERDSNPLGFVVTSYLTEKENRG
ncbi:TPA: virB8 family protein [Providencia stuartii]|uniref:virB8 family protein n=1 Tax=Morganellaceae TaxID=1903414 RepID=UPI000BA03515|nr:MULTISPECIES: type IV secretion system protein [Enterobacterales]EBU6655464.1 conjugal transfer protein [Salmonella enterica subsp. enterica serovar Typhimurium]EEP1426229.1 type IV secretion system protein [Salmonella enterica]EJF7775393.1 type IV secretion system protein [Salmonella enterica subsp. enterica]HAU5617147.1 type IV secretion system protein [Morganella morganii]MCS6716726.1 type IV secretion system protein [Proteus mirabilis]